MKTTEKKIVPEEYLLYLKVLYEWTPLHNTFFWFSLWFIVFFSFLFYSCLAWIFMHYSQHCCTSYSTVPESVWNEPRTVTTSVLVLRQSYALTTQLDFRNLLEKKALLTQITVRDSSKIINKKELWKETVSQDWHCSCCAYSVVAGLQKTCSLVEGRHHGDASCLCKLPIFSE